MPENVKQFGHPKVVHLEPESQRLTRSKIARLPAPVHAAHEKGLMLISSQLRIFFDKADDSLFELADKAHSNQEQNVYFDSMREVRVQRRGLEKRFTESIDQAFAALVSGDYVPPHDTGDLTADALSLVQNEDLEEMVAVDSSISRANTDFGEDIQAISLRLDSLVPVKVYQKNNPLGPDVVCQAFMTQIKRLDIGIKAKLVLFKLFDRIVVKGLGDVYKTVNQILIDHNVLPTLTRQGRSRESNDPISSGNYGGQITQTGMGLNQEIPSQHSNNEVIQALQSILTQQSTAPARTSELSQVLHLLSIAQQRVYQTNQVSQRIDVRSVLDQLQQQQGFNANIGRVDDEVINLVNMLFEFILDDRNLAPQMKTLISRMQIPVIKVALVDKSFFTKGGHAARRLLNEIATAAIGWQAPEGERKDPLLKKVETVVQRLIEDFDTDVSIFTELLIDFTSFLEKEKRRVSVVERRTIDAEDGKAKAEVARTLVSIEVELRVLDKRLPVVAIRLIKDVWSNVMFVNALKFGYSSNEWGDCLDTLSEFVVSVEAPKSAEQRQRLIRSVPGLLKKLRTGFDTISYNPFEMASIFKELEAVHLARIKGNPLKVKTMSVELAQRMSAQLGSDAEEKQKDEPIKVLKSSQQAAKVNNRETTTEKPSSNAAKPKNTANEAKSTSTQPSKPSPKPKAARGVLPEDDPHMVQVQRFVQGSWFDFKNEDGSQSRSRLAAYIKPTGKYIFVNRNGVKVAEKTQLDLAWLLKDNNLQPLDNSVLFDRALETVVTSLRKN